MALYRAAMLVLAVLHGLFVLLTSMVGAFADGGSFGERLLLMGIHPLGAVGLIVLVFSLHLSARLLRVIAFVLIVNVATDLFLAVLIAQGTVKGDWELALAFAVVPAMGIVYALKQPPSPAA